jgi:hypothetical protein
MLCPHYTVKRSRVSLCPEILFLPGFSTWIRFGFGLGSGWVRVGYPESGEAMGTQCVTNGKSSAIVSAIATLKNKNNESENY